MEVARLVGKEYDYKFEVQSEEQSEEHWIHTQPTWLIAARESFLELFCD